MKLFNLLITTFFLLSFHAHAKLSFVEVNTEGTGTTKQLAILDGLKNAITQVNGAVVGASTSVSISEASSSQDQSSSYESSQAFQQNIKSATKGVVQGFDILSVTQNPDLGNMFIIEMKVKVAKYKKSKHPQTSRKSTKICVVPGE